MEPPANPDHPASSISVRIPSHGVLLNAQIYRPSGAGAHPTVLLFHGLPGNEQNLDLAQALRRAGWTVVTFHYTGSWGSGGRFTLRNGVNDAHALFDSLRDPAAAERWGVDPKRILLIGHSFGGYVAARAASVEEGVIGVVLLAPWDISHDARAWSAMPRAARDAAIATMFGEADGRLSGATHQSVGAEILAHGASLDLAKLAKPLSGRPILLITAIHDDDDDKAENLLASLKQLDAPRLVYEVMDTDHSFNDHRITLQSSILRWLATLGDAPPP